MEEKERFEILLEHMNKDIQTVLECHVSLDRKIDRGLEEARIDRESIKQQLTLVAQTLVGKIEKNREKVEQVDQKVQINREAIETNRQEIVGNRKKIEVVDDKLSSGLKQYADHEERIKTLEVIS
jgi:hypothetical protein